jgi:hypothetical protein
VSAQTETSVDEYNRDAHGMTIRGGRPSSVHSRMRAPLRIRSISPAAKHGPSSARTVSALPTYRLIRRRRITVIGRAGVIGLGRVERGTPYHSDIGFDRSRKRDFSHGTWVCPAAPNGKGIAQALSGLSTFLRTRIPPIALHGRVGGRLVRHRQHKK